MTSPKLFEGIVLRDEDQVNSAASETQPCFTVSLEYENLEQIPYFSLYREAKKALMGAKEQFEGILQG